MYLPVPGFEHTSFEFLNKCVFCKVTVVAVVNALVN